ncbi:MAG TPA: hypothetical protein DF296_01610 [Candidatus Margulisbacteria bacterium]|nr:MAG: hypothetical protein A2X43_08855 [Candidatus Margulisbacteria bacterium GWD2_39_127]OGI01464.1 MAG: hypothetical protein A2X42_09870 [Candidatus Margulisbacteria bacterium GWF2_38_17]OGI10715.1 MAG: hypothetical protein A2X41_06315 [Candidatus Margulisbacteria bacterium GWE2_39_32]HAR63272.1 hypothetical protein [Candidatus Margulisiibacteriota bacterium]HCT83874.1 hypothetical protein [Candidatus Margulisiibacteriota bacterium]
MPNNDEKIKEDVKNQLLWDSRVNADVLTVDVQDGQVILSGAVLDRIARESAERDAWSVHGVASVVNLLAILNYPIGPILNDDELKNKIYDTFHWHPTIDASKISVSVNEGLVTLRGITNSYWEKVKAEEFTYDIKGVISIVNELAVVPGNMISDQAIAEAVIQAFARNKFIDIDSIDVKVENGSITLSGIVRSWTGYQLAQEIVQSTLGVVNIDNKLFVKE